jgi:hypothetical protein
MVLTVMLLLLLLFCLHIQLTQMIMVVQRCQPEFAAQL